MGDFKTIVGEVKIAKEKDGYSVHDDECFICGTLGINEEKFKDLVNKATAHNSDKENILKVRYDKKNNDYVDILVKHKTSENTGVKQDKLFEEVDGKIYFVYDEEIGGEVELYFGEDEKSPFVQISSDYVCDIRSMLEIVESVINWEET